VVFGGDADVFHTGVGDGLDPLVGIEIAGGEGLCQRTVLGTGNFQVFLDPLRAAGDVSVLPFSTQLRVKPPVNEHAETRVIEPTHAFRLLLRRVLIGRRFGKRGNFLCKR